MRTRTADLYRVLGVVWTIKTAISGYAEKLVAPHRDISILRVRLLQHLARTKPGKSRLCASMGISPQTPMALETARTRNEQSSLDKVAPFLQLIALFGIPMAGWVGLIFLLQLPRILYGQAVPLFLAAEIGGWVAVIVLVLALRACLALPSAPTGLYRNMLDFFAMARWHASVKAALVGLIVLTSAWYFRADRDFFFLLGIMGRRVLASGDFRDDMDRILVAYQLALTGGVPLLFVLHMLTRWKPKNRILPWVLVPALFLGTAIIVVVIGTIMHFAN